jgi:hypothetical protein
MFDTEARGVQVSPKGTPFVLSRRALFEKSRFLVLSLGILFEGSRRFEGAKSPPLGLGDRTGRCAGRHVVTTRCRRGSRGKSRPCGDVLDRSGRERWCHDGCVG